jgi:hypothetical protein
VDGFGGLAAAIHDAAQHAKLPPGFRTTYIELEPKGLTRLLDLFAQGAARAALRVVGPVPTGLLFGADAPAAGVGADFERLLSNGLTPRVLAHCLCQAP